MTDSPCHQLDDYLTGTLPPGEMTRYVDHLTVCASCRREIELQDAIDLALRAPAPDLERPPKDLVERIDRQSKSSRPGRAVLWTAACVAAAASLFGVVWHVHSWRKHVADPPGHQRVTQARPAGDQPVEIRFDPADNVIAVPMPTESDEVSIVWVYPVYQPPDRTTP
jgi:anti-sigma factor RsiW